MQTNRYGIKVKVNIHNSPYTPFRWEVKHNGIWKWGLMCGASDIYDLWEGVGHL